MRTIKPSTLYSPTLWHLTCVRITKHREVPPKLATSKSSQQINVETNKKVEASENLLAGTWASPAGLLTHINCAVTEIDVIRGGTRRPGKKKKRVPSRTTHLQNGFKLEYFTEYMLVLSLSCPFWIAWRKLVLPFKCAFGRRGPMATINANTAAAVCIILAFLKTSRRRCWSAHLWCDSIWRKSQ